MYTSISKKFQRGVHLGYVPFHITISLVPRHSKNRLGTRLIQQLMQLHSQTGWHLGTRLQGNKKNVRQYFQEISQRGFPPWVCPISGTASFLDWAAPRNEATNGMFLKQESSLSCLFPGLQWCCPKVQKQGLHAEDLHLHCHNQKQSCPTTNSLGARVNWETLFECLTAYCKLALYSGH